MLAVLTHHLGTALVSFYVDFTFGTAFDRGVVIVRLKEWTGNKEITVELQWTIFSFQLAKGHKTLVLVLQSILFTQTGPFLLYVLKSCWPGTVFTGNGEADPQGPSWQVQAHSFPGQFPVYWSKGSDTVRQTFHRTLNSSRVWLTVLQHCRSVKQFSNEVK